MSRVAITALAAVVGLLAGGAVGLVSQGSPAVVLDSGSVPSPPPVIRPVAPDTLLAWTPGGLPDGFAGRVGNLPGVAHATSVRSGVAWMTASFAGDGRRVDRPPRGLSIPLEVAGIDLRTYGAFLPPAQRAAMESLARGQAVLGETSARLRRLGPGAQLRFGTRSVRVAAVLPDSSIGAHEVALSREAAAELGVTRQRYLLIDPEPESRRSALSSAIRTVLPPGRQVRIRGPGETPYFRQGDAVLPQVRIKELFGEFAASPRPDGSIEMDPAWASRHIVTVSLPVLGAVTCHRALIPQLRGALQEIARRG
jgi:MacB-like periplasmic core domain